MRKTKRKNKAKQRNLVAKDLLTNPLYKRKIHTNRKKSERNKHKENEND